MKRTLLLFALLFSFCVLSASIVPKAVSKGCQSVVSIVTFKAGVLHGNGYAVFVGGGDVLASSDIFAGADSAVVIDFKGNVRPVRYIVGLNDVFDCIKVRVDSDKKIKPLVAAGSKVYAGDELYMPAYGVKGKGTVESVKVISVDSLYSCAYYTLDKRMQEHYISLPLLNEEGELVAVMQSSAPGDTINSYAVGQSVIHSLVSSAKDYGKGYYKGMGIRTALPSAKEEALSCLYMQTMIGDSLSWLNTVEDYIRCYPDSYEGYLSLAEFSAVYERNMERASAAWKKSLSTAKDKSEVHFGKGKVIAAIVQSGDSVSHEMLSLDNAFAELDRAISIKPQSLYISCKADLLLSLRRFDEALDCYGSIDDTTPEIYARLSQCYVGKSDFDSAIAMLDSAVALYGESKKEVAPYIMSRASVKVTAERFREAVLDLNRYEELADGMLSAGFYYMREQAELNCRMYQQALNDIETAIYLAPEVPLYYFEKGMLCYRVKLTDEGIRTMEKARELAPDISDVHYLLGRLFIQNGNKEKAMESLERAGELGHPDAAAQLESLK